MRHVVTIGIVLTGVAWAIGSSAYDSFGPETGTRSQRLATPSGGWPLYFGYFQSGSNLLDDLFVYYNQCYSAEANLPVQCTTKNAIDNDEYNYLLQTTHAAFAGYAASDPAVRDLFVCPVGAYSGTNGAHLDLSQCAPAKWNDALQLSSTAWAKTRTEWNAETPQNLVATGHSAEHMKILEAALPYANLATGPLMTARAWVRYPTIDSYVGSPLDTSEPMWAIDPSVPYSPNVLVSQSWIPSAFENMTAHALRSVYLPELAQIPDEANSVGDWAGGAEVCPLAGLDGSDSNGRVISAFSATPGDTSQDDNACHDFVRIMGITNESHFLPKGHAAWHGYHGLALARMKQCAAMAKNLSASYYPALGGLLNGSIHAPPNDSEIQVCEREAMAYEMFGDHFLEDAWASGHMWSRWGTPNYEEFPSDYSHSAWPSMVADVAPLVDIPARRYVISGFVASVSGEIHGAKGVLEGEPVIGGRDISLNDDPLCGPVFSPAQFTHATSVPTSYVSWSTLINPSIYDAGSMLPFATNTYSGAGDLFWNTSSAARVATQARYDEQRGHLLLCLARSMLDVYAVAPTGLGSFGPLSSSGLPTLPVNLAGTTESVAANDPRLDPDGDFCWGQRVTNDSIYGSLGPVNGWTTGGSNWLPWANRTLFNQRKSTAFFQNDKDFSSFKKFTEAQYSLDNDYLRSFIVEARAGGNGQGTDASFLGTAPPPLAPKYQVSLLGVPPGQSVDNSNPGVNYFDNVQDSQFGAGLSLTSGATKTDGFVAGMFWRGHLEQICSKPDTVTNLRDRCVNAEPYGGDPEACTACVDIAEFFTPLMSGSLQQSKCQAVGFTDMGSLPAEWSDATLWRNSIQYGSLIGVDPYYTAMAYCTNTWVQYPSLFGSAGVPGTGMSDGYTACYVPGTPDANNFDLWHEDLVIAEAQTELDGVVYGPPPIISASLMGTVSRKEWLGADGTCNLYTTYSRDDVDWPSVAAPLPIWNAGGEEKGDYAILNQDDINLATPFCGVVQRSSMFNRQCADVFARVKMNVDTTNGSYDPQTGAAWSDRVLADDPTEYRCDVREARQFQPTCPQGACDSAGICVPARNNVALPNGAAAGPPITILAVPKD